MLTTFIELCESQKLENFKAQLEKADFFQKKPVKIVISSVDVLDKNAVKASLEDVVTQLGSLNIFIPNGASAFASGFAGSLTVPWLATHTNMLCTTFF